MGGASLWLLRNSNSCRRLLNDKFRFQGPCRYLTEAATYSLIFYRVTNLNNSESFWKTLMSQPVFSCLNVNNGNTRKKCLKSVLVNFEQILHILLVCLLSTLSKWVSAAWTLLKTNYRAFHFLGNSNNLINAFECLWNYSNLTG